MRLRTLLLLVVTTSVVSCKDRQFENTSSIASDEERELVLDQKLDRKATVEHLYDSLQKKFKDIADKSLKFRSLKSNAFFRDLYFETKLTYLGAYSPSLNPDLELKKLKESINPTVFISSEYRRHSLSEFF